MGAAPDFWWQPKPALTAIALAPAGWIYGAIAGRRMLRRPKYHSKVPVICIGNFVAGGTGKTPFALRLAERLAEEGYHPGVLLRGYGGRLKGPVLVDPEIHSAEDVGDEALLLAAAGPTVISTDRAAGARHLETEPVDLILMDDGFQNPSLHKDLSLVLVDCAVGFGNGLCIPAGPMRAPASTQIVKADALILVGQGAAAEPAIHLAGRKGLPILHARMVPTPNDQLSERGLYAFAGIGRPEKFFRTLREQGLLVKETRSYPDHHAFTDTEAQTLLTTAEEKGLQLVTTAKDMARIDGSNREMLRWLAARTVVLEVTMKLPEEDRLIGLIRESLRRRSFHL